MECLDSPTAYQSRLLVAVEIGIRYKGSGITFVKLDAKTTEKKPYQKPRLRVYGDIRTMTQLSPNKGMMRDAVLGGGNTKTR
jgi:hypothetical protein